MVSPTALKHRRLPILALCLLFPSCGGGGGGGSPATGNTMREPELASLQAELLGILVEAKTITDEAGQVAVLRGFLLGEAGDRNAMEVRTAARNLVQRSGITDVRRTTASLTFVVATAAPGTTTSGLDAKLLGRLVAEAVRSGAADPTRPRFRSLLRRDLAGRDASLTLDPALPLRDSLSLATMVEHIAEPGYEEIGRALRPVIDGTLTLAEANHVVHAQLNALLDDLIAKFPELGGHDAPSTGSLDFTRAQRMLSTVGRVSDFVFGRLFTGPTAEKIGDTLRIVTNSIGAVAKIGGAIFSGGLSAVFSPDLLGQVFGMFGLGEDNAVEQQLAQLQHSIRQLAELMSLTRLEMHARFDRLEGRIARLQQRVDQMFREMIRGFDQIADLLETGFAGLDALMRQLRQDLHDLQDDVRQMYTAVRWWAYEAWLRAMEAQLVAFDGHAAAAATGDRAAFAQARAVLSSAAVGETFVRSAPIQTLRDLVPWLPSPSSNQAYVRVAGIGALVPAAYQVGVSGVAPVNFHCLHDLGLQILDVVETRPGIVTDREFDDLVTDLEAQIDLSWRFLSSLGALMDTSVELLVEHADRVQADWIELLRPAHAMLTPSFQGASNPDLGPLLRDYLRSDYFDPDTSEGRLPFVDRDTTFVEIVSWPPAPGTLPLNELAYEFEPRRNGEPSRFRRGPDGYDHLRLGIALGLIRVEETSRTATLESLRLRWNVPSAIRDPGLRSLHGSLVCNLELAAGNQAVPPLAVISSVSSPNSRSFAEFYALDVRQRVDVYLGEVRDQVDQAIASTAPRPMQNLVDVYAVAAGLRYACEIATEAAGTDPLLGGVLRDVLDQPIVFHQQLVSGWFAMRSGQTPRSYEDGIFDGLLDTLARLRGGEEGMPADLADVKFYDQLFHDHLAANMSELSQVVLGSAVPRLRNRTYRFAAVDELTETITRLRNSRTR